MMAGRRSPSSACSIPRRADGSRPGSGSGLAPVAAKGVDEGQELPVRVGEVEARELGRLEPSGLGVLAELQPLVGLEHDQVGGKAPHRPAVLEDGLAQKALHADPAAELLEELAHERVGVALPRFGLPSRELPFPAQVAARKAPRREDAALAVQDSGD
jgi:hypothetical protein